MKRSPNRFTLRNGFTVLFTALLLVACTETRLVSPADDSSNTPPALSNSESDGDYLLRMSVRIRNATSSELAAELEGLQRVFAARRSEDNRVRLAAFLAIAPLPYGDRNKALALLDIPPGENAGRGRQHPYATLLLPLLLDVRRAEDNQSIAQSKLREEQKRYETLQQSAEALRQNAESMRQKLEAIRDIEKKLLERPNPK